MIRSLSVSVVVPTKNETGNIPHLLASVPLDVELVVCDASTDETRSLISTLRPERTVIVDAPGSIAAARNRGAAASSGRVLVFTDADVVFDPAYFTRLLVDAGNWDGIFGAKRSRGPFAADYDLMLHAQRLAFRWLGVAGASGSNMAMSRRAFERVGGFRDALRCNEDTELFLRAGRRGLHLRFDQHLVVWARDHRRLRAGRLAKAAHSLSRNLLLYLFCRDPRLPAFLEDDWGYWPRTAIGGCRR